MESTTTHDAGNDPLAQLIAMRAKGEIDEREFNLARKYLGDEIAKRGNTQAVSPDGKFNCSETIGVKGGGKRTAMGLWFLGLFAFIISAVLTAAIPPIIYLGILVWVFVSLAGVVTIFTGVPNFYREGPCPRCKTKVRLISEGDRSTKCPGCKHQMLLRGNKMYDVS
ncbi:hypothetical protein NKL05_27885 [Mesorhizobium sp. C420B]|uniref:SHOCT domain-containing protein n=1 Tax=Mesorhizobium sp. C420B TaxID=2956835 RepID=UPI0033386620